MTSGVYDFVNDADFVAAYVANPLLPFSLSELVAIIQRNKPLFPPGTDIAYDNSGYYLLGAIAEKVSGLPLTQTWVKALATGTLLTPATQDLRLRTKVLAQTPAVTIRYGLGIASFNGFLGHDGSIFGYGSTAIHLPAKDATIVAVGNAGGIYANPAPLFIVLAVAAYLFPEYFPNGI
jgi:CubicO group peptidase (beta-lactamase class C family)